MANNDNSHVNYGAVDNRTDSNGTNPTALATTASKEPDAPLSAGDQQQHSAVGILFITLGAFSFSIMYLIVKLMAETSTFTLVLYRSMVQIVLSSLSLWKSGQNLLGDPNDRFWLVMRGTFGAGAVCAWFFGIQHLPLPDAVTLQFTTPPFAATFGVFLLGEPYLPLDVVGAFVCLTGVALIAHPTWLFGSDSDAINDDNTTDEKDNHGSSRMMKTLAILITELGAAMAGIAYVSVRRIHRDCPATTMVLYYGVASLPLCFLGSRYFEGTWNAWRISNFEGRDYILLLLMGLGGYGGQWFTNMGLQRETAATVSFT
jgi:drug/metabolite transporter (DMT)-like permease